MRHIVFILVFTLSYSLLSSAQRPNNNNYNVAGEKEGLWIWNDGGENVDYFNNNARWAVYDTYKNGKMNGLCISLMKNTVSAFAVYHDGQPIGTFVQCNLGRVVSIVFECGPNTKYSITDNEGKKYYPDYKGYAMNFYPEGELESEGVLVWNKEDDFEIDSIEYGEWKFYDKSGKLSIKQFAQ